MTNEMERRVRTAAQIANYGSHFGLLPYQIDEAVRTGISLLDDGKSGARAYGDGRRVVNQLAHNLIGLQA